MAFSPLVQDSHPTMTVTSSAQSFEDASVTVPHPAGYAELFVRDASVVYTFDGTTPTASIGRVADPDDYIILRSHAEIDAFQAIREGGTDAVLDITWYTEPL